ncbi:hypothetical protein EUZ85_19925 [Hahella sp. KA22]|uniref:hypothetical protein n=1 Tax=Hahella sp. KA22 TaxID=1628392 RepID=UPI000FDF5A49|nr:hypothetical protein [Hahella sp. KA22]AZZ92870.1 hypothetical protein ENC22_17345 [Hahella sp. KA22]QAY56244.1 hypothetical protein EUZ85_19925 [Hahella sp. KA22]
MATGLSMGGIIAAITADIPVYAAIAAGVGGASGICNTIFRIYKNAELIRNLFATHTMNPEINPHMNPHMSSSDFNSMIEAKYDGQSNVDFNTQVIKQSGGYKESFMALMREMRPKW